MDLALVLFHWLLLHHFLSEWLEQPVHNYSNWHSLFCAVTNDTAKQTKKG